MEVVNLKEKLKLFEDQWSHRTVGRVNDVDVKLVKIEGEFIWHSHDIEDELFYVVEGRLDMHFRESVKTLRPGELIIIPHGVEHKPVATVETHIMLIEPNTTVNTGNVADSHFRHDPKDI
jgi:mannose-6-phosphate isomerase-like protein (cupin superfamily)